MHKAIVARVKVTPHPDKDVHSLAVGHILGETLIVGKDTIDGSIGLYFPCDLQIGEKFAKANDLIRRKNPETGDPEGGMFDENRRVKAIKLRGVKSNGFWCPLSHLSHFGDVSSLKEGDRLDSFCDVEICRKYVSRRNKSAGPANGKTSKKKELCFPEHSDTSQLKYNMHAVKVGDELIITAKLHGTSQRTGYVLANRQLSWWEKLATKIGLKVSDKQLDYLNGTRRVVLNSSKTGYHAPELRSISADKLLPFIEEHMIVYYEVVGFEPSGASIMPSHNMEKLRDKQLQKKYGKTITYSYGCPIGESDVYVYRIVYVLPNGKTIDLSWDEVKNKCESWGVKHVPELCRIKVESVDSAIAKIDELSDGEDPIDNRHIIEGVCVRINKSGWHTFKNKGFTFKVLEGIMKDDENYEDLEEES